MNKHIILFLLFEVGRTSQGENDGHNAVNAPSPEAIRLGRIFKAYSPFFNPKNEFGVNLKLGNNMRNKLVPIVKNNRLSFKEADEVKIPSNLLKSKFKETVCKDTMLDPDVACPNVTDHRYPLYDGRCNNRIDINKGKAFRPLKRLVAARYGDGFQTLRKAARGFDLPTPRVVTNHLQNKAPKVSEMTHMFTQWGQFIIHDIVHTPVILAEDGSDLDCNCDNPHPECINIPIPRTDEQFIKEGRTCFSLPRSIPTPDANCQFTQREQINQISSYIDGTTVYGVDDSLIKDIRDPESDAGELKVGTKYSGELHGATLPQTDEMFHSNGKPRCPLKLNRSKDHCFFAGDKRINENAGLASMHTLFVREHNRVARELKSHNPSWSSDTCFNEARLIIAALHQVITYNEYLPALLGPIYMERYNLPLIKNGYFYGYDATVDASVSNAFTTAAFRFGHSMIIDQLSLLDADWQERQTPLKMRDNLFNPEAYINDEKNVTLINPIVRGLLIDMSLETETTFPDSMRNFLFAEEDEFGKDLFAINIQRGREHGLGTYNDYRDFFGMQRARDFSELKEISADMRMRLSTVYDHVDDIDLYVGGLAEEHVPGGLVGPTFAHMMAAQFRDLKFGDRFYFENGACETIFTPAQVDELRKFRLSTLICTCTDTETVQIDPFLPVDDVTNPRINCDDVPMLNLTAWRESFLHTKDHLGFQDSGKWSDWIPPLSSPPSLELDVLKRERPDDLCLNTISSELRFVNEQPQVRFMCPAGEVIGSDFPPACLDRGKWTPWFDRSNPSASNGDDNEEVRHLRHERPDEICEHPLYVQAQTVDEVPARESGDVLHSIDARRGLICLGKHQESGKCQDYRVRFFCPNGSIMPQGLLADKLRDGYEQGLIDWTPYFSADNPSSIGDVEYLEDARAQMPGICAVPYAIEAVTTTDGVDARETGDVFRWFTPRKGLVCLNDDQTDGQCDDYKVRYLCQKNADYDYPDPETEGYWSDFGKGHIFGPYAEVCYDYWPGRCELYAEKSNCDPKWKVLSKLCKKSCNQCAANSLDLSHLGIMGNKIWMQIAPDVDAADQEFDQVNRN